MRRIIALLVALVIVAPVTGVAARTEPASRFGAFGAGVSPAAAMPAGAVGYWRFDEASGDTAVDSSGTGNDGSITGATRIPGVSGSALDLDGAGDRVVVPNSPTLEPAQLTVAAWVRSAANPGPWRSLIDKGLIRCSAASYMLKSSGSGGLVFGIWNGSNTPFTPDAGPRVWDGNWHLATGTFDGSAIRLYVDGVLIGSTAAPAMIRYGLPDRSDLVIGNPHDEDLCGQGSQFAGDIDEVRIWGRALNQSEIQSLLPPFPTTAASAVGVSSSTFYPYKDGYRDSVALRGTPNEPMQSVSVKIYNNTGKAVRSWSYSSRTTPWSIAWNGRTASGTRLAAGKYKVVQTLIDMVGQSHSYTSYTTISNKRLYYYTKSQTRYGASFSGYDYTAYAWVSPAYSVFSRGVDLFGNSGPEYAAVKYIFTLPSAAVYKSLKWSALGKAKHGGGPATLELWDFRNKNYDARKETRLSYGWYTLSASATNRVSSRKVYAWVTAYGGDWSHWDVAKVRLTYTYGVLK